MDKALKTQCLIRLDEWHEDDEIALCAKETPNGWYLARWFFYDTEDTDASWGRTIEESQIFGISDLARIPPVAVLLKACKALSAAIDDVSEYAGTDEMSAAYELAAIAIAAFEDRDG